LFFSFFLERVGMRRGIEKQRREGGRPAERGKWGREKTQPVG
jgi:hypothetical protein